MVDDEEAIVKILKLRLEHAGYSVTTANNGLKAIESVLENNPDLIVMDCMMPEMDGYEATKKLKANPKTKNIPIIMLTAKADKESRAHGLKVGVDDYIAKPIDFDKLTERIRLL